MPGSGLWGWKPPKEAVVQAVVQYLAAPVETALLAPASGPGPGEALVPAREPAPVWVPVPWWDLSWWDPVAKGPAGSHSRSNAP
ncbi:hypothetical protein StoSoilB13_42490 (plasmid) [Arthrobacter sp. StoSoilB13]|nr:hypothetical protein StoSoilB13_42490 [Arthrobacter sp. StoSoilB13]